MFLKFIKPIEIKLPISCLVSIKWKFWPIPADLVTFTEEILNGKLYFLCSVHSNLWGIAKWHMFLWHWRLGKKHCTKKWSLTIKNLLSKCDKIRRKLQIWSHLLKKSLMILISCTKCPVGKDLFLVNNEVVRIFSKVNVSVC